MLRKISGPVESIRAVAVTSVSNNTSSTHHQTSLRVGGEAVQLRTGSLPNIHPGDQINVAVIRLFGDNRVVAWHATSTGARGTIAIKELLVLTGIGVFGLCAAASTGKPMAAWLGLATLGPAAIMAWVQAKARKLVA